MGQTTKKSDEIAAAMRDLFSSPNVPDRNMEAANAVDTLDDCARGLHSISTQLKYLGNGDTGSTMGAIENHAVQIKEGSERIADGLEAIASALRDIAEAIKESK